MLLHESDDGVRHRKSMFGKALASLVYEDVAAELGFDNPELS
jgi:hypothetical protein